MAETDSFDESINDVNIPSYKQRKKYIVPKERANTASYLEGDEIDSSIEGDFEDDSVMLVEKPATKNCSRKFRKRNKKIKSPLIYSPSQPVDSSYLRVPSAKKRTNGISKRRRNNETEVEISPPKKKLRYSMNAESPFTDDSFPSFLANSEDKKDSNSESESSSTKSAKHVGTWGKKYDFQDKDLSLPESSASGDSDNDWLPKRKERVCWSNRVKRFSYAYQNLEVITLIHPAELILMNCISIRVISGGVCVHGYEMNQDVPPLTVFSSKRTGYIMLKTEYPEELWKKKVSFSRTRKNLKEIVPEPLVQSILSVCNNSTIIVALKRIVHPPALRFLSLYYPELFAFDKNPEHYSQFYKSDKIKETIVFHPEFEQLADKIKHAIQKSKLKHKPGQRILVFGHKKTGKSTLLQYLLNKTLSMFIDRYYLDTDPGQTVFTPPGAVSLTKVKAPLMGSPFLHQKQPIKMIFTGSVTPDASPPMYEKSVRQLAEYYNSMYSSATLFVNTMGWITGIGLECLLSVVKAVEPTIVIEILSKAKPSKINYQELLDVKGVKYFQIDCDFPAISSTLQASEIRDISVLSYLGRCQKPHLDALYLNDFKPICISWDKIPIYIFGKKLVPYRIVEAINASFVALCHVDESLIMESDIPCFQKTLQEDPDNDCLGFGIVRAVDEENHLLYIVTPLSQDELKNVNAIMKGNIQLPANVFTKQPLVNTPLPFTDSSKPTRRKGIPKRYRQRE